MSARVYDHGELYLLERTVAMVKGRAAVDEWRTNFDDEHRRSTTIQIREWVGPPGLIHNMSREEALEQLMEWCASQLQALRAPAEPSNVKLTVAGTEMTKVKTFEP